MNNKLSFTFWLHDGTQLTVKGDNYAELLGNIDIVFDKVKENTSYYLGCDDETIIEELKEEIDDIEIEEGEC